MKPLAQEDSLAGLIARKVLAPGYKGFFEVSEPGTQICSVGRLLGMRSVQRYPPMYQGMLDAELDAEEGYITAYLAKRGGVVGREVIEKKVNAIMDSILRIVSSLHGKPHAEDEVFFSGCFLDDAIAY